MKHLIAMLFYNVVIGGTVMFRKEHNEFINYEGYQWECDIKFKHHKYKVIGIYIMRKGAFTPANIFRMGVVLENTSGKKEYCGINAVKHIDNIK